MQLTDLGVIKDLFNRHGFSFTKSLGQNFLINPSICPKIAELGGCGKDICSLEIGTGIGVLTKELALRSKKTVAIEIDKGLQPILAETLYDFSNIDIIFADFMEIDLKKLFEEKFKDEEVVICANLPYYITSPVIMRILEEKLPVKSLTVMVQREAADRICAKVGSRECGALTVAVNYYSDPKKLFNVSRGSFAPSPNVDSSVIRLDIDGNQKYSVSDERLFFRTIKSAFSQRRKQMVNPLSSDLRIEKQKMSEIMTAAGIKTAARAEELSMEDFINLCNKVHKYFCSN